MKTDRVTQHRTAFTLIELLVVVAIIGLLVAVLLPAFGTVRNKAKRLSAQAQFNSISTGISLFQAEGKLGGAIPPSASDNPNDFRLIRNPKDLQSGNGGSSTVKIAGAHLLVYAMVGADGLGTAGFRDLDRDGTWWDDTHNNTDGLYETDQTTGELKYPRYPGGGAYVDEKMQEHLSSLTQLEGKGLALNLSGAGTDLAVDEPLFVDPWDMPILYYRANSALFRMTSESNKPGIFRQEDNGIITGTQNGIVNSTGIDFGAGPVSASGPLHSITEAKSPLPTEKVDVILEATEYDHSFARFIVTPKKKARPTPINKDSYLLISAGADGRYGTDDDITNWTTTED